jgi:hypothetical protein
MMTIENSIVLLVDDRADKELLLRIVTNRPTCYEAQKRQSRACIL